MATPERVEALIKQLEEQNLGDKYHHPGIYSISIDGHLVYIGKSLDMLVRIANHMACIENPEKCHKYIILNQAYQKNLKIQFDVAYYSYGKTEEEIKQDIGKEESRLIRRFKPALNYQIPREEDYTHFSVNKRAKIVSLEEILRGPRCVAL